MDVDVLEHLRNDHRCFERFFGAIEEQCAIIKSGKQPDMPRLRAIATYLDTCAFPPHHALEDAMFNQIVRRIQRFREEIFDLLNDHEFSKLGLRIFTRAVESNDPDLARIGLGFVENERAHFMSEEEIVFLCAAKYLTTDQWRELRENLDVNVRRTPTSVDLDTIGDLIT